MNFSLKLKTQLPLLYYCLCQDELSRKQTDQIVGTILEDLLTGVKTPERPRSPVDANVTEEEIFRRKNPKVHLIFLQVSYCSCLMLVACSIMLEWTDFQQLFSTAIAEALGHLWSMLSLYDPILN